MERQREKQRTSENLYSTGRQCAVPRYCHPPCRNLLVFSQECAPLLCNGIFLRIDEALTGLAVAEGTLGCWVIQIAVEAAACILSIESIPLLAFLLKPVENMLVAIFLAIFGEFCPEFV